MKKILRLSIAVFFITGLLISQQIKYDVTKPDTSSKWSKGTKRFINWDKKGDPAPKVKIRLYKFPGMVKILDIVDDTGNDGSFLWEVPFEVSEGSYIVRVKSINNLNWGDSKVFEIIKGLKDINSAKGLLKGRGEKKFKAPPDNLLKPVIEGAFDAPLGALKPGSKLMLMGKKFGSEKGRILLKGNFPGGQIDLVNVTWLSNKKAYGFVPQSANGQPNQLVDVVLVTSHRFKSDPLKIEFVGREEKTLVFGDAVVLQCGDNADGNLCNQITGVHPDSVCHSGTVICGWHFNQWADIDYNSGIDRYQIKLNNGWFFKRLNILKWLLTSGNEKLSGPSPSLPVGQSEWYPTISWEVSPNDWVVYQLEVIVEGPIGTNYK